MGWLVKGYFPCFPESRNLKRRTWTYNGRFPLDPLDSEVPRFISSAFLWWSHLYSYISLFMWIDGLVQDIQADHLTLLVYNTLTTLVLFDSSNFNERYEVQMNAINDDEASDSDNVLEESAPKVVSKEVNKKYRQSLIRKRGNQLREEKWWLQGSLKCR